MIAGYRAATKLQHFRDTTTIIGQPDRAGEDWYFRGQTEYGNFKINTNDTKKIKFGGWYGSTIGTSKGVDNIEKSSPPSDVNTSETPIEPVKKPNEGDSTINKFINNIINSGNTVISDSGNTINYNFNLIMEIVLFALLSIAVLKFVPKMLKKRKK